MARRTVGELWRETRAGWLEGVAFASLTAVVMFAGGATVRASYHGLLHVTVGEAVWREGLQPENPYHAGTPLRYYTLYPWLGVALGRVLGGPLRGFAVLNVLAALFFPLCLDSFGRALGLAVRARRAALVAALAGFNLWGTLGLAFGETVPWGRTPLEVLGRATWADRAWGWDPRLESFVTKWWNATSFPLSLPPALWALACAARLPAQSWGASLGLAAAAALNPATGLWVAVTLLVWHVPALAREQGWRRWRGPAVVAGGFVLASPALLALAAPAVEGPSLLPIRLRGTLAANIAGPLLPLGLAAGAALPSLRRRAAGLAWSAAGAALVLFLAGHGRLPFGNEYKFVRLAALPLALGAGVWLARPRRGLGAVAAWTLALAGLAAGVGTAAAAYLAWGARAAPLPFVEQGGHLALPAALAREVFPPALARAEARASADAVLLTHPSHPRSRLEDGRIQGSLLAPLVRHPLLVDRPQIHNARLADLPERLEAWERFWREPGLDAKREALERLRAFCPARPLLVLSHERLQAVEALLAAVPGARCLAREAGFALWQLQPLGK